MQGILLKLCLKLQCENYNINVINILEAYKEFVFKLCLRLKSENYNINVINILEVYKEFVFKLCLRLKSENYNIVTKILECIRNLYLRHNFYNMNALHQTMDPFWEFN
jgi:hypothetical protein